MKIRIAICIEDSTYSEKLSSHFSAHYGDSVEMYRFSDETLLNKYLETHVMDVLLVDEKFDERNVLEWPEMLVFKLTNSGNSVIEEGRIIYICRYQKASNIYKEILHWCSKKEFSVKKGSGKTIVISFSSIVGGAGASTISVAFAIYLARQGRKVVFLNLEEFGDTSVLLGDGGKYNFEEILLALKTKNRNVTMKLQSAISHTEDNVFFYSSCSNPIDFSQMTGDETKELLDSMISMDYQYVVTDFRLDLSDKSRRIMNASDKIVLISDGTNNSKKRFGRIFTALKSVDGMERTRNCDKLAILSNKAENGKSIDISADGVFNIGTISEIKSDSPSEIARTIAGKNNVFNELG